MARARWAKWRAAAGTRPQPEPRMWRWHRFEYAVRDKVSGEVAWRDLVSVRQAAGATGLILRFYAGPEVLTADNTDSADKAVGRRPLRGE